MCAVVEKAAFTLTGACFLRVACVRLSFTTHSMASAFRSLHGVKGMKKSNVCLCEVSHGNEYCRRASLEGSSQDEAEPGGRCIAAHVPHHGRIMIG